jgi:membrane protein YdbS with pleckstrin-like domain
MMKKYFRLASVTLGGIVAMGMLVVALQAAKGVFIAQGHDVPEESFSIVTLLLLLVVFGIAAKLVMREVHRLNKHRED